MVTGGYLRPPLMFFSRYNRLGNICKADPIYKGSECWYDWATVKWDVEILPAKLLLFFDIKKENLIKPFTVGSTTISDVGSYALCYSMNYHTKIQAHTTSYLVSYGKIMVEDDGKTPSLCMFLLDAIENMITAVPFNTSKRIDIINSYEWLFLCCKNEWYKIFVKFMKDNNELT